MGELMMDDLDAVPLAQSDPKLWAKVSPKMRESIIKTETAAGIRTAPGQQLPPAAQAEKDAIFREHYTPTPQELEAMTPEQYRRWRSLEPEGPTQTFSRAPIVSLSTPEGRPEEPSIPTLEAMSDTEYRAWYLSREGSK